MTSRFDAMRCFRLLGVITLLLSFSLPAAWAQGGRMQGSRIPDQPAQQNLGVQRELQTQRLKKRFADIQRDSQKLLELATELKRNVDKSGENILSLDVLRKAEEMEKLARQVKNNMRDQ
jgi:hypothetical protein